MQVFGLNSLEELSPYSDAWDRLSAGVPFRSWTWLSTWWRHYGRDFPRARLFVPCVFDDADALVGLAPWWAESSAAHGCVLRMLGSGEAASDYLSVLCQPGKEEQVSEALAEHITEIACDARGDSLRWDLIELSGVDAEDRVTARLAAELGELGNKVHRRPGVNCWRLELPTSWDGLLALFSKKRRTRIRRFEQTYFNNQRAVLRWVETADEVPAAVDLLIDLHQRRWRSLRRPGCYASPRFAAFVRETASAMFRQGQAQVYWLEIDGKPATAEFLLLGNGVLYAYQTGVDPDALEHEPGKLINLLMFRRAIEQGCRAFDFLRGDEPYKIHFHAAPRPSVEFRVVPNRAAAQLRHNLWLAGNNVKQWIKSGLGIRG